MFDKKVCDVLVGFSFLKSDWLICLMYLIDLASCYLYTIIQLKLPGNIVFLLQCTLCSFICADFL